MTTPVPPPEDLRSEPESAGLVAGMMGWLAPRIIWLM